MLPLDDYMKVCESYFDNDGKFIDSDGDGLSDERELALGASPFNPADGEKASNHFEEELRATKYLDSEMSKISRKLKPLAMDTDNDGLRDYDETDIYGTDPENSDSDGDGYPDGEEVKRGFDPNSK
jgi:hypothetical protein